jgi:putative ABC transport system permease protein
MRTFAHGTRTRAAPRPYPDVELPTESELVKSQNAWIDKMLQLLYVLLGVSLLVSFFGIVNTLVLSIVERTRELGALHALGMTRRQMRRIVRHESVITALIGAVMGIALGIGLAALVIRRLSDYSVSTGGDGMHLAIPIGSLVVFAFVSVICRSRCRGTSRAARDAVEHPRCSPV